MFIADILPAGGVGRSNPLRLGATQMVVSTDDGTPFCIIDDHGPDGAWRVMKAGDLGFAAALKELGMAPVTCQKVSLPPAPRGAKLLNAS